MKVKKKALHVKPGGALSSRPLRAPKAPRVACYLRVSSRAQTAETQLDAIMQASSARGDLVALTYEEKRSAKTMLRPELTRLRHDAQAGKLSKVYVFRLDRLTRTGIKDTFTVLEELRAAGCKVVSVADGFDLEGPAAEIIIAVMAWAAQMERLATNERIAAARDRVEREGRTWGRPSKVIDATTRDAIARHRREGHSIRWIAAALKIHRATVGRAVKELGK